MKIAIITETFLPYTDGIVTRLCATIRWLVGNGDDVCIIAPDLGVTEFESARVMGVPAFSFFLYRGKKLSWPSRKVGRILREFDPDIVHVVNPAVLGVAGIYYSKRYRYPLVASYHTKIPQYADFYRLPFLKPMLWWYFRVLHNRADLNLCTSEDVKAELSAKKFRQVHLWSRGVDLDLYSPARRNDEMRSLLSGSQPDKILLLYVGRLAAEKEIEKIRDVLAASSDFCLAIVGDGPIRETLETHFKETNTVFTGILRGQVLASAYASSDVLIFPSTTETLGLVILEAMASGLPVAAASSGPTSEQIDNGETGLIYDPKKSGSLLNTVLQLKVDAERKRIGRNAYEAAKKHGWEKPSEQLRDYYMKVLQQSRNLPS